MIVIRMEAAGSFKKFMDGEKGLFEKGARVAEERRRPRLRAFGIGSEGPPSTCQGGGRPRPSANSLAKTGQPNPS